MCIHLNEILPEGGRFSIIIDQILPIESNTYTKKQLDIFYDPNPIDPTLEDFNIYEEKQILKWLSGVAYYDIGSILGIELINLLNINNRSYPTPFIFVDLTDFGFNKDTYISGSDIPDWTPLYCHEILNTKVTKFELKEEYIRVISQLAQPKISLIDWEILPEQEGNVFPILIDTFPKTSTWLNEDFRDEFYRLNQDLTHPWDSKSTLGQTDLQIVNDTLVRQYHNWTQYNPSVNVADYSNANSEEQYYFREFKSSKRNYYNGLFKINGTLTEQNLIDEDVKILISLDGVSWYNCNKEWNGLTLSDGDACRINLDTHILPELEFTLSVFYTNENTGSQRIHDNTQVGGYGLYLKIIYTSKFNGYIDYVRLVNWI